MATSDPPQDWSDYYRHTRGRPPRLLLRNALAHLPLAAAPEQRQAIDLGCGDGTETVLLLREGWQVLAIDAEPQALQLVQARVPPEARARLVTNVRTFEGLHLPAADLIYAGFSLPFCHPAHFANLWMTILAALRPGGVLAVNLFGARDSWAANPAMTFHRRADAEALFAPLHRLWFNEIDEPGWAVHGPKHWHVFEMVGQRSAAAP